MEAVILIYASIAVALFVAFLFGIDRWSIEDWFGAAVCAVLWPPIVCLAMLLWFMGVDWNATGRDGDDEKRN